MRAYGDKALFRRFRWRFTLAPILLLAASVFCAIQGIHTALLLAFVWGAWHWMMQGYGFMRIYDAKSGSFSSLTMWLDFAMCVAWFGFALFLSPRPIFDLLFRFQESGGVVLSAEVISGLQHVWAGATILVTAAFGVNATWHWIKGTPPNPLKLLLMAITFTYYWYTLAIVPNGLVAYALFEMFHDVQYLTIVWMFNRARSEQTDAGAFTRFLFRQRGPLIVLYIGLCLLYGMFDFAARSLESGIVYNVLLALVLASSMLHFYFDGFIWKIREQETGKNLGIESAGKGFSWPAAWRPLRHAAFWSLFVVPFCLLSYAELSGRVATPLERSRSLGKALPDNPVAQSALCAVLLDHDEVEQAIAACRRALALKSDDATSQENLGNAYLAQGDWRRAEKTFRSALNIRDTSFTAQNGLGIALAKQGRHGEAVACFQLAITLDGDNAMARANCAESLISDERFEGAETYLTTALELEPDNTPWRIRLAEVLLKQAKYDMAMSQAVAVSKTPEYAVDGFRLIAITLIQQGRFKEAEQQLQTCLQVCSDSPAAALMLGEFLVEQRKYTEAEQVYREASISFPDSYKAHFGLGLQLFRRNALKESEQALRTAAKLTTSNPSVPHHVGAVLGQAGKIRGVDSVLREGP